MIALFFKSVSWLLYVDGIFTNTIRLLESIQIILVMHHMYETLNSFIARKKLYFKIKNVIFFESYSF